MRRSPSTVSSVSATPARPPRSCSWIQDRCGELGPDGSLQVAYGLDGRHKLPEEVLSHLEGYRCSAPVRIGNDAYLQLQLDISGELMDAVYLYNKFGEPIGYDFWRNLARLVDWVCANWELPDMGIWEVRGGRQQFLLSRVMCWVAIDRGIRLATQALVPRAHRAVGRDPRPDLSRHLRALLEPGPEGVRAAPRRQHDRRVEPPDAADALHQPDRSALAVHHGSDRARTSSPTRWSIATRWTRPRRTACTGQDGTFCMCSFWYAECLARGGDVDQARFIFEKMLGYSNHLGLYAEELGPRGELLGNFPQAFTHLALISAAYEIDRVLSATGRPE